MEVWAPVSEVITASRGFSSFTVAPVILETSILGSRMVGGKEIAVPAWPVWVIEDSHSDGVALPSLGAGNDPASVQVSTGSHAVPAVLRVNVSTFASRLRVKNVGETFWLGQ